MLPSDWQMTSCALLCFAVVLMNPIGALNKKVDVIADINPMKLAWTLKVVIMRLYEFPIKWNPREIYSMELVLQDEMGDRIHCSIPKSNMVVFRTLIREHELYAMKNFIVQAIGQSVRTTSNKYKLSFYTKTFVSLLSSDNFLFNSFQFISYEKIEAMVGVNKNHLLDCMGHVVGREDVTPLVTKSREESKCIKLHLEDLKENIMKCTLVGDLVDKILGLFNKNNVFMPLSCFLTLRSSMFLHSKYRLIKRGDLKAQCINYIQSHPVNSVSDELHGGSLQITTIEEVFDKTNLVAMIGIIICARVGFNALLRYGLHVIADDGTVCIGLIIWNQEANLVVKKFANKVKDLSYSGSESIFECDLETPGKGVVADSNAGATIGGVYSLDVQGSTTKPSKGCAGKRKL
ncbi:hypothetical protein AHAS_Ahas07G0154000 [Arachis hypogaea]